MSGVAAGRQALVGLRRLLPSGADVASMRRQPGADLLAGIGDRHTRALDALAVPERLCVHGRVFAHTREAIGAARDLLHFTGVLIPGPRREPDANAARNIG